jgi:hypothetical protein
MRITIAVHGHFRETSAVGRNELSVVLPDTGSLRIRDLLEGLNILEDEVRQVELNGRRARIDSGVRHRCRIELFPKRK